MVVRVMHLLTSFEVGGAESVALNLAAGMDRERFHLMACSLSGDGPMAERFRAQGIAALPLNGCDALGLRKTAQMRRLVKTLKVEKVDVLHCHNPLPTVYGAVAGLLARLPAVVCTRHSMSMVRKPRQRWWLEECLRPLVAHYVAVSGGVLEDSVEKRRAAADRASVIYNGVDTERFAPAQHSKRGAVEVGCVARLSEDKRHCDLIEAVRILLEWGVQVRLVIVGDGAMRASLETQAKRAGLGTSVRFLGNRSDIPALLGEFDLFALPSRWEGLPLTLLEAMAAGLPVVATDVGSVSEVVEEGVNGLLAPVQKPETLAKAIAKLAKDPDLRKRMGAEGRKAALAKFSLKAAVQAHEDLYMELLAHRRNRGAALETTRSARSASVL